MTPPWLTEIQTDLEWIGMVDYDGAETPLVMWHTLTLKGVAHYPFGANWIFELWRMQGEGTRIELPR